MSGSSGPVVNGFDVNSISILLSVFLFVVILLFLVYHIDYNKSATALFLKNMLYYIKIIKAIGGEGR